jgi:hypothetical protein
VRALALLVAPPLSLSLLVACDGATKPPFVPEASPTATVEATPEAPATPTPTAVPEPGGMAGFRAFAALIDAALAEGDASFFSDRGEEMEVTCQGDEQLGFCMGQPPGTIFRGIPGTAWQSDAFALFPTDDYESLLEDWFAEVLLDQSDEFGDGAVKLFALAQLGAGDGEFLAITTAILNTGPATEVQRQARMLRFAFEEGAWKLRGEILGAVSFTAEPWLSGDCTDCYDQWERWEGTP